MTSLLTLIFSLFSLMPGGSSHSHGLVSLEHPNHDITCDIIFSLLSLMPGGSSRSHDLVSLEHPNHVVDEGGEKKFRIRLDVSKFKPEEIEVRIFRLWPTADK